MSEDFEKYPDSCLYWIHLPDGCVEHGVEPHTDPFTQGYIGVSVHGAQKRFKNHKWHAARGSKLVIHSAIRKYGDALVVKVLLQGSPDYCLSIEKTLRPAENIAWNLGAGGKRGASTQTVLSDEAKSKISHANKGRVCSVETRAKMSASRTGLKRTLAQRQAASLRPRKPHSEETKARMSAEWDQGRDWEHPRAKKDTWSLALALQEYVENSPSHGAERSHKAVGLPRSNSVSMFKKLKSGWNPSTDEAYLSWLKQYKEAEIAQTQPS